MSQVRFISDYHFGHENMAKWRGFDNAFEMDEHIIKMHNLVVGKRDLTYILGDITMEKSKWYFYLDQMAGRKKVILGNHDRLQDVPELLKYVDGVAGMVNYNKNTFLTHCPVHPNEFEYRMWYNIHGHVHGKTLDDPRYINVSCEAVNYTPKTMKELFDDREIKI